MRLPWLAWLLATGLCLCQTAGSACAQESPLVPPWGRDLDEGHPTTRVAETDAEARIHEETAQRRQWRFSADYWVGWTKNDRVPALLTTGPTTDARPGALGQPFTRLLYGDAVDYEDRHGGRFAFETSLGSTGAWSLAAAYLFLGSRTVGPNEFSPGSPVLARPFFNAADHREDSSLVTFPGLASGTIAIRSNSLLQGAEANLQRSVLEHEHVAVTILAGFRYLHLDENLIITETSQLSASAPTFPGRTITVYDRFGADNDFYGGQIGFRMELTHRRWIFAATPKVAFGNVHQSILIQGRTTIDTAPITDIPAGLLALPTNSGRFARDTFAVVPEISGKIGLRITERLTISGGYTFLYCSRIARPGEQIDRNLNPSFIPTSFGTGPAEPKQPTTLFRTSDYWAHGMTWGLEFRY
jgi:hypothetical protein